VRYGVGEDVGYGVEGDAVGCGVGGLVGDDVGIAVGFGVDGVVGSVGGGVVGCGVGFAEVRFSPP